MPQNATCHQGLSYAGPLANYEDQDEMHAQNVTFHQGLHCLLRQKR